MKLALAFCKLFGLWAIDLVSQGEDPGWGRWSARPGGRRTDLFDRTIKCPSEGLCYNHEPFARIFSSLVIGPRRHSAGAAGEVVGVYRHAAPTELGRG